MPRYIAITDIHGELRKLESVLSQIDIQPDDIFVQFEEPSVVLTDRIPKREVRSSYDYGYDIGTHLWDNFYEKEIKE